MSWPNGGSARRTLSRDGARGPLLLLHERLCLLGDQVGGRLRLPTIRVLDRVELHLLVLLLLLLSAATKVADELGEGSSRVGDELGVCALLGDLTVLDADDVINRREEMEGVRDQDARLGGERAADGVVEEVLADVCV